MMMSCFWNKWIVAKSGFWDTCLNLSRICQLDVPAYQCWCSYFKLKCSAIRFKHYRVIHWATTDSHKLAQQAWCLCQFLMAMVGKIRSDIIISTDYVETYTKTLTFRRIQLKSLKIRQNACPVFHCQEQSTLFDVTSTYPFLFISNFVDIYLIKNNTSNNIQLSIYKVVFYLPITNKKNKLRKEN